VLVAAAAAAALLLASDLAGTAAAAAAIDEPSDGGSDSSSGDSSSSGSGSSDSGSRRSVGHSDLQPLVVSPLPALGQPAPPPYAYPPNDIRGGWHMSRMDAQNSDGIVGAGITPSGGLAWMHGMSGVALAASPVYSAARGAVYVGTQDGIVQAISADCNGVVLWARQLQFSVIASPVLDDAEVALYVATTALDPVNGGGRLYALNTTDGSLLWNSPWEPPNPNRACACVRLAVRGNCARASVC
jgi:hypothetical protein